MDYETGKNFEKVQALLEEHEQKINYLMIKLGEKTTTKTATEKPAETPTEENQEEAEKEAEQTVEEIVKQEHEEPTVKAKKSRWGRKTKEEKDETPNRML